MLSLNIMKFSAKKEIDKIRYVFSKCYAQFCYTEKHQSEERVKNEKKY